MNKTRLNLSFCMLAFLMISMPALAEDSIDSRLISKIISSSEEDMREARDYIALNKPVSLLPSLKKIILANPTEKKGALAFRALQSFPIKESLSTWLDMLRTTQSVSLKKEIIDFISTTGERGIVPHLVEELKSPHHDVRESAILGLKRIGDDRMLPYMLNFSRDPNPIYRVYALQAFFHIYDRRINDILMELIKDDNKSVRYFTLKCIENHKLTDYLVTIRNLALNDPEWEVRVKSITIMRAFNDRENLYVLLQCLADKHREIRYAAAVSLLEVVNAGSSYQVSTQLDLETDDEIKDMLLEMLLKSRSTGGMKGFERILMHDQNRALKIKAAFALGEIGDPSALPLLLQSLDAAQDSFLKAELSNTIGLFRGQPGSAQRLLPGLGASNTQYLRLASLYAIERLQDRAVTPQLFSIFSSEKEPVMREKLRELVQQFLER
ncbi:MAG: HEAT repeat domain-containing protein [Spirochaetes bacterium]|nr:MAG: HEAT repeat domain-containing protein [Spirochaetota bacterium]